MATRRRRSKKAGAGLRTRSHVQSDNVLLAVKADPLPSQGLEDIQPYLFYVISDRDNVPRRDIIFMGVRGRLNTPDRWPVILHQDGRIDFGAESGDDQRYYQTNLRTREMVTGQLFTVFEADPDQGVKETEVTYRIASVQKVAG